MRLQVPRWQDRLKIGIKGGCVGKVNLSFSGGQPIIPNDMTLTLVIPYVTGVPHADVIVDYPNMAAAININIDCHVKNVSDPSIISLPGNIVLDGGDLVAVNFVMLSVLGGSLDVESPSLPIISLPALVSIGGSLSVNLNSLVTALTTISLPALTTITQSLILNSVPNLVTLNLNGLSGTLNGILEINGCPVLPAINLPLVQHVAGGLVIDNNNLLASIDLHNLVDSTGSSGQLRITSNPALTSVDLTLLVTVDSIMDIVGNTLLNTLLIPNLATVGLIDGSSLLVTSFDGTTLNFTSLTRVGGDFHVDNSATLVTLNAPILTTALSLAINNNPALTSINFADLATLSAGDLEMSNTGLVAFSFPDLTSVSHSIDIANNASLNATADFPVLIDVALGNPNSAFNLTNCIGLVTLNAPMLVSVGSASSNVILGDSCTNLTNLNLGALVPTDGMTISFISCALSQASVDLVLHRAVLAGMTTGTIDLSGGTSSAPSVTGATDKTTLQTAGVVVNTN